MGGGMFFVGIGKKNYAWGQGRGLAGGGEGGGTLLLLTPPLSKVGWLTVGWLTVGWLKKPEKDEKRKKSLKPKKTFVSLQPNISNAPFDRRSPRLPEEGVLRRHRPTQCVGL